MVAEQIKNGIVIESNAEYHGYTQAISKSRLERMSVCPKHFKYFEDNPPKKTTDLIIGSAFHKLVLEPEEFGKEFIVRPNLDKRSKEWKTIKDDFEQASIGLDVLETDQYEQIQEMRDCVLASKYAVKVLKGTHEQSMYFIDDGTNELCKVRPDNYKKKGNSVLITDLKSCKSALSEDFSRDIVKYGYDLQAYMYSYGVSKVLNVPIENIMFVFVAVQKTPPYLVNVVQIDAPILERGEMLFRKYIGEYHICKQTNNWYGLNGADDLPNVISLPPYLLKQENKGE